MSLGGVRILDEHDIVLFRHVAGCHQRSQLASDIVSWMFRSSATTHNCKCIHCNTCTVIGLSEAVPDASKVGSIACSTPSTACSALTKQQLQSNHVLCVRLGKNLDNAEAAVTAKPHLWRQRSGVSLGLLGLHHLVVQGDDYVDWVGMSIYHYGTTFPFDVNVVPAAQEFTATVSLLNVQHAEQASCFDNMCSLALTCP